MGIFSKSIGPVFVKEDSDTSAFIEKMKALSSEASPRIKEEIDKQIKLASYGEAGEKNIAYELKNSGLDMYILHDIYLEHEDLSAQIDYLIVCRKKVYILECKNLVGDIEVDSNGQFIRKYEINGKKYKESIYNIKLKEFFSNTDLAIENDAVYNTMSGKIGTLPSNVDYDNPPSSLIKNRFVWIGK